jgi:hypothetical protein
MSNLIHSGMVDLACYTAAGVKLEPRFSEAGGAGVTLAASTTYYFPLNIDGAICEAVQLRGLTAALIITAARIEDTCFPMASSGKGDVDVSNFDAGVGNWMIENPSTAYVPVVGTGWVATNAIVAVAGGAVGGALWNLGNMGTRRARLAIVVGGTGGDVRVAGHAKG